MPQMAMGKNTMLPTLPAPTAAGPKGPAINVSTMPMNIQPSSAIASGAARRSMGRNSRRRSAREIMGFHGAGTLACRVETRLDSLAVRQTSQNAEMNLGAADMSVRAMSSCLRVRLIVHRHEIGQRDLCVFLSSGEARVAQ